MANVTITTTPAAPLVGGTTITINFAWDAAVTGFTSADVSVSDTGSNTYTKGTMQGSGQNWTMTVTLPNTTTTMSVQVQANAVTQGNTLTTATSSIQLGPPTIAIINEQTIVIGTTDYQLEVAVTGTPTRVYAEGEMEGFYQNWDATRSVLQIKSVEVTRLITGGIWKITAIRGSHTVTRNITYNVIPAAPIITDPGAQTVYRDGLFYVNMPIANRPAVARGTGLLSGLKYQAAQGETAGIVTRGILPRDAVLTESSFTAAYYAENDGGNDNLTVAFTIETHDGVYVYGTSENKLHKVGPDAATLHWSYTKPSGYPDPDSAVVTPDGIYLFFRFVGNYIGKYILKVSPKGKLLWSATLPSLRGTAKVLVTLEGVYVYTGSVLAKIDPSTGGVLWTTDAVYLSSIVVLNGDVYVVRSRKTGGYLKKVNGADGSVVWTYEQNSISSTFWGFGDGIYFKSGSRFYKVNAETGLQVWESAASFGSSYAPVANSTGIYIQEASSRRVSKINLSDGTTAWTFTAPFQVTARFIVEGNSLYLQPATPQRPVLKLNTADGTQAWITAALTGANNYIEVYPNGLYYRLSNSFYRIDPATGTQAWVISGYSVLDVDDQIIEDGSDLYVIYQRRNIRKLNVSDGTTQWTYMLPSASGGYNNIYLPEFFK